MTESREGNPFLPKIRNHFRTAVTTEISPLDDRIAMLVGTGEVLMQRSVFHTGRLLNLPSEHAPSTDAFSVFPTPGLFPRLLEKQGKEGTTEFLFEPFQTYRTAKIMASYYAQIPYFLSRIGLPLHDDHWQRIAKDYLTFIDPQEQQVIQSFIADAVDPDIIQNLTQIAEKTKERKGILLGVNQNAYYTLIEEAPYAFPLSQEVWVSFGPQGMSYKDIVAMEALGPPEQRFINDFLNN